MKYQKKFEFLNNYDELFLQSMKIGTLQDMGEDGQTITRRITFYIARFIDASTATVLSEP